MPSKASKRRSRHCTLSNGNPKRAFDTEDEAIAAREKSYLDKPGIYAVDVYACTEHGWHMGRTKPTDEYRLHRSLLRTKDKWDEVLVGWLIGVIKSCVYGYPPPPIPKSRRLSAGGELQSQ